MSSLNFFGPKRPTRSNTPPLVLMDMDMDKPPVLPPLNFEEPQHQSFQFPDWNFLPPSPPPNTKNEGPPSNLDLAAMFEQRCRSWIDAINARDFGPESSLWQDKAPTWKSRRACNFSAHNMEAHNLEEFIESNRQTMTQNPLVRLRVLDCTTNMYKNDNGKIEFAESFLNVEVTGAPPGITRRSVAVYNWRLIGGKWLSTGHKSLPGMVVMGPDNMY